MIIDTNSEEYTRMLDFLAIHFGSGKGKRALGYLRDIFKDQVVADPSKEAAHAFFREGERSVIMKIELMMEDYNRRQKEK